MKHSRSLIAASVLLAFGTSAWAQNAGSHLPNAAPLESMQRARSYSVLNRSSQVIVSAEAHMTNGDVRNLNWGKPIRPQEGRNVVVPSTDCLAGLTVDLKSGHKLQTSGTPDCRANRITVTDNGIQIGSSALSKPPVD